MTHAQTLFSDFLLLDGALAILQAKTGLYLHCNATPLSARAHRRSRSIRAAPRALRATSRQFFCLGNKPLWAGRTRHACWHRLRAVT